jgi:hypothetical protein
MSPERDVDPNAHLVEQEALNRIADRLAHGRPAPLPTFRAELRERLIAPRQTQRAGRRPLTVAFSYAGTGLLLLVGAAAGLVGIGPFAT